MKRNLLALILTLATTEGLSLAHAATAVQAWARTYGNRTASADRAYFVATDSAGNAIVAGTTDEGTTSDDILIIKYSSAGVALWTNRYNGPENGTDQPSALAVDSGGKIYVTGYSEGPGSSWDYVTLSYSSAGVALWTNRYNGPANGSDQASGLAVDSSGKVFVTGYSDGIGTGRDFLTIAYSSAGVGLWTNRYNGSDNGDDIGVALAAAADGSGNVYVTGYSYGAGTQEDYLTIGYTGGGAMLWVNHYNGPGNSYDEPTAVAAASGGNVYVTGYSVAGGFNEDYATVAYSSAGTPLWTNRYNGPANGVDDPFGMAVAGGNVYVTGLSHGGTTDYDIATIAYSGAGVALWTNRYNGPGNGDDESFAMAADASGNIYATGYSSGISSGNDCTTIAYSSTGMILWLTRFNGAGNSTDQGYAVAVASSGNVFVAGYSLSGTGGDDWATVAYSGLGVGLWTNRYDGPGNGDDTAYAVAVDGSGRIYVTGASRGANSGLDWATVAYSSSGVALWTNRFNTATFNSEDVPRAIAVDASGNVYVTGYCVNSSYDYATMAYSSAGAALWTNYYDGPISYGDVSQAIALGVGKVYVTGYSQNTNGDDYATIAYSSAGTPLWTNRYDGPNHATDRAFAIAADTGGTGNVYVTGGASGPDTSYDYTTVAYSSAGVALWTNFYVGGAGGDDVATAMAVGPNGNVYITGSSYRTDTAEDYATVAYSSAGTALWTNRYNGPADNTDVALGLAVDGNGNVFVTGYSAGSGSDFDYLTIAYTSAGVPLWTNRLNGTGNAADRAEAVAVDGNGRVYVTGYLQSDTSDASADVTTIAYSTSGVALWTNTYNGFFNGTDQPLSSQSLAVGRDGSVVVVGQSRTSYHGSAFDYITLKYATEPPLSIALTSTNTAVVSWPLPSTDFVLEQNTNLSTAVWTSPPESVSSNATRKYIVANPPIGRRSFRLRLAP